MASAAGHRHPQCHVLNIFFDNHDSSALTVLVNDVRFHIVADASRLKAETGPGVKLAKEYRQLLAAVKQEENDSTTRPCSKQNLRGRGRDSNSQDSGHGTGDEQDPDDEQDSAVDVNSPSKKSSILQEAGEDPEKALNNWLLTPFGTIFDKHAPKFAQREELSLQEWYERPTMFFNLDIEDGELKATEVKTSRTLEKRMVDLTPKMYLPKYIREINIPWYPAKDITVLDDSDDPAPYHPTRVRIGGETFFIKMVDPMQPSPTKREIGLMKKVERLGLHKKLRVPLVKGLVGFQDSKTEMIGFLQTNIEDATPLTHMFGDEVPQRKRDKWAKESERVKEVLHENGIVWGDAKADNFMIDKNDDLWIIDFGGSYTAGWVDPELMETVEGDDMGVGRIVNALHDPNANTWDAEDDKMLPFQPVEEKRLPMEKASKAAGKKRKADEVAQAAEKDVRAQADAGNEQSPPSKRARKEKTSNSVPHEAAAEGVAEEPDDGEGAPAAGNNDDNERQRHYCVCNELSSGDMVGCDNHDCHRQWFHFGCVGLNSAPKLKHWYCDDCKEDSS